MIIVNTCHITDEPLFLDGTETKDILELENDADRIPVSDITYNLIATKSGSGQDLLVNGTATFQLKSNCVRCMKELVIPIVTENLCIFREKVPDQEVDITEDVREELLLALPDYIHCSEDCKGLCCHCGANLNDGPCECNSGDDTEDLSSNEDNPWNVLDQLKQ